MERERFRRRVMVRAVGSPWVYLPAGLGVWLLATAALLGNLTGLFALLGLAGLALGAGVAATRLLRGTERLAAEVMQEEQDAKREAVLARLKEVERRLEKTRDVKTFEAIRLLRSQRTRLLEAVEMERFSVPPALVSSSEELYRSCVDSLERSAVLWETAREMATPEARQGLMDKRAGLVDEVRRSVGQWAAALDRLQSAPLEREREASLRRVRDELDAELAVARRVEARMRDLERETGAMGERIDTC